MNIDAELSNAAEELGRLCGDAVVPLLLVLLKHDSPLVRESAVYGLEHQPHSQVIEDRLRYVAEHDPSPGVRAAAKDVVSDIEWMSAPLTAEESAAVREAVTGESVPWE